MKNVINTLKIDKVTSWGFGISAGFLFLTAIIIVLFFRFFPPLVPLFNGMSWGYARLANKLLFFLPVGIAIIFFIVNCILSALIYKQTALLSRLICATTILLSIITGIFTLQIILLVR